MAHSICVVLKKVSPYRVSFRTAKCNQIKKSYLLDTWRLRYILFYVSKLFIDPSRIYFLQSKPNSLKRFSVDLAFGNIFCVFFFIGNRPYYQGHQKQQSVLSLTYNNVFTYTYWIQIEQKHIGLLFSIDLLDHETRIPMIDRL